MKRSEFKEMLREVLRNGPTQDSDWLSDNILALMDKVNILPPCSGCELAPHRNLEDCTHEWEQE